MSAGPQPTSREGQVRGFFARNPHESLSVADMQLKFGLTKNRAYKIARHLKLLGLIVSSKTIPVVYRGASFVQNISQAVQI